MKKSVSKHYEESLEEEVKRLRKEVRTLRASKDATKAKLTAARAELKKKHVAKKTLTKEQKELISMLSVLFPDIDIHSL